MMINTFFKLYFESVMLNQELPRRGNSSVEKMTTQTSSLFSLASGERKGEGVCLVFLPSLHSSGIYKIKIGDIKL